MEKVLNCPCCGHDAVLKHCTQGYGTSGVRVECSICHIGTCVVVIDTLYNFYKGESEKIFNREEAEREVIGIWNSRAYNTKLLKAAACI